MNVKRKKVVLPKETKFDSVIFGIISKQYYEDYLDNVEERIGGPLIYANSACASNNSYVALVTKFSDEDSFMLDYLNGKNSKIFHYNDTNSHCLTIKLKKINQTQEKAFVYYDLRTTTFNETNLPNVSAYNYLFLEGAIGDYDINLIKKCSELGDVALDGSAFINKVDNTTGLLTYTEDNTIKEIIPYCHYIKFTSEESELLTGKTNVKEACEIIKSWGAQEIIITKRDIVCVLDKNGNYIEERIVEKPNLNYAFLDTTVFVSYVNQRITSDPIYSLYCACAIGTLKLKRPGPLLCNRADIDHCLKFYYYFKPVETIEPVEDDI